MISINKNTYVLDTQNTTYVFRITKTGHPEHLYYGKRIRAGEGLFPTRVFAPGNTNTYDNNHKDLSLEDICLEISSPGKGDPGEPFVEIINPDGSFTSDFVVESVMVSSGGPDLKTLPCSYTDGERGEEDLLIVMKERNSDIYLELGWHIYSECDVITRTSKLINRGGVPVTVRRLMSVMLDSPHGYGAVFTNFTGAWTREMCRSDRTLISGKYVSESRHGTSSSRANPFCMISDPGTGEDSGCVYGFNLVYSGDHYECAEIGSFGRLRFISGIHPDRFSWRLMPGETFEAPEGVMSFSDRGFNGLSSNMHSFVREHIVRGTWKHKARPIVLNSWEASYFDINERKLLKLARAGKDVGIELFVMDDGWFGEREDDTTSLGDWYPNRDKLPGGVKGIADKVKALGLMFGIWVEPEMVSTESGLYMAHPDWALEIPGRDHSEGRNQRFLDFTRKDVQDHIIKVMSNIFGSADISYVKWDMNRTFTDVYSQALAEERSDALAQYEVPHRYMMGLYRVMDALTKRFPDILFEGCASGGNRFDLGILSYFPQIWASDNTDPICRGEIQNGCSYGYPMSVVSSHVSGSPNHQTLRETPPATRFAAAAFGVLGYECNIADLVTEQRQVIADQITLYKAWRDVFFHGDFYRGRGYSGTLSPAGITGIGITGEGAAAPSDEVFPGRGNIMEWTVVSKDRKRAVGMLLQSMTVPNMQFQYYLPRGLDPDKKYRFYNIPETVNIKEFGYLVNTVSPIHIRPGSTVHEIASRLLKLDGETEDITAYGDSLMSAGVRLKPAYSGVGFSDKVRLFPDRAARLYYMEAVEEQADE
ncbi:MAG: alpha-galactosidase [Eubacterium sp.]|nr:alpha-galactosidase [Eubacterium sp.]